MTTTARCAVGRNIHGSFLPIAFIPGRPNHLHHLYRPRLIGHRIGVFRQLSRDQSVEPIQMDHRDTMYTEKTRNSPARIGSLIGDFLDPTLSLVFLCVHRVSVVLSAFATAWTRRRARWLGKKGGLRWGIGSGVFRGPVVVVGGDEGGDGTAKTRAVKLGCVSSQTITDAAGQPRRDDQPPPRRGQAPVGGELCTPAARRSPAAGPWPGAEDRVHRGRGGVNLGTGPNPLPGGHPHAGFLSPDGIPPRTEPTALRHRHPVGRPVRTGGGPRAPLRPVRRCPRSTLFAYFRSKPVL